MPITIVAIGHKLPRWAEDATDDYLKRLPPEWQVVLKTPKPVDPDTAPLERVLQLEAARLIAAAPPRACWIALDEHGKDLTTTAFAEQLRRWRDDGETLCFAIGGANGLAPEIKSRATSVLRLSSMTLPHPLARVLLAEQLYRAYSLLAGHPYHRT